MIIEDSSTIVRKEDVLTTDLDGELGMIDIESGKYYAFDPISSTIWGLIEKPMSVKQLVARLMEEFEVDEPTCLSHTIELLASLHEKKLIAVT